MSDDYRIKHDFDRGVVHGGRRDLPPPKDTTYRRTLLYVALAVFAVLALLAWDGSRTTRAMSRLRLGDPAVGQVMMYPKGNPQPQLVQVGEIFRAGDQCATSPKAQGYLQLPERGAITLGENTGLLIQQLSFDGDNAQITREFFLRVGKIWVRTTPVRSPSVFIINTINWRIETSGGQFSVYITPVADTRYVQNTVIVSTQDATLKLSRTDPQRDFELIPNQTLVIQPRLNAPLSPSPLSAAEKSSFDNAGPGMDDEGFGRKFRVGLTALEQRTVLRFWSRAAGLVGAGGASRTAKADRNALDRARDAGRSLIKLLEGSVGVHDGYPDTLNLLTLEPLAIRAAEKKRILAAMLDRRLQSYRSNKQSYELLFRARDSNNTLLQVTSSGVVVIETDTGR